MAFTPITVTRRYLTAELTPATGTVRMTPTAPMVNGDTVVAASRVGTLDAEGDLTLVVAANNDPATTPTPVSYEVREDIDGQPTRTYYVVVPYDAAGGTVALSSLTTAAVPPVVTYPVAGPAGPAGLNTIAATPLAAPSASYPTLTIPTGNVMLTQAACGLASIYWPCVVDLAGKIDTAPGRFAMLYSTDHDAGAGGIGVAYADHPLGPWTADPGNPVYVDTTAGVQTETPWAMWDETNARLNVYYQQDGVGVQQSTLLAHTTDLTTFTRVGIAINGMSDLAGDGHTGYFKAFRVGSGWAGFHLFGGGDFSAGGISYSYDGITWRTDPRRLVAQSEIAGDNDHRVLWNTMLPFWWRGQMWASVATGPHTSGLTAANRSWWFAPMAPDMRGFAGLPIEQAPGLPAGEDTREGITSMIEHEGTLYCYYRANGADGDVRVATVGA